MERERLRETFGGVPELYDRARPRYPDRLFADLVELTEGTRLVEIGCGTGQATRDLVRHGFDVTCVELSADLAALARRNVPEAEIVVADVERWQPERAGFDVVAAFTAFHWLDPDTRRETASRLLREGGSIAIVETHHVMGEDRFFADVQEDYDAVVPHPDNAPPPPGDDVDTGATRRYLVDIEYTPDEYIAVLGTYSSNLALPSAQREELFRRIRARAAAQGTVVKTYLFTLTVTQVDSR